MPVSSTRSFSSQRCRPPSSPERSTSTRPRSVNFTALPSRLVTIWRNRPGVANDRVSAGAGRCARSARGVLFRHAARNQASRRPRPPRPAERSCIRASTVPALILEMSRMSLMMVIKRVAGFHDDVGEGSPGAASFGPGEQLGHAQHAVHRRADLVAHLGQEFGLRLVGGLGQVHCKRFCFGRKAAVDARFPPAAEATQRHEGQNPATLSCWCRRAACLPRSAAALRSASRAARAASAAGYANSELLVADLPRGSICFGLPCLRPAGDRGCGLCRAARPGKVADDRRRFKTRSRPPAERPGRTLLPVARTARRFRRRTARRGRPSWPRVGARLLAPGSCLAPSATSAALFGSRAMRRQVERSMRSTLRRKSLRLFSMSMMTAVLTANSSSPDG